MKVTFEKSNLSKGLKGVMAGVLLAATALAGATLAWAAAAESEQGVATSAPKPAEVRGGDATTQSPALGEILKMADAKVSPEIIKAYIHISPIAYKPSAADIIDLRKRGVSEDIILALIEHGEAPQAKSASSSQATASASTSPSSAESSKVPAPVYAAPAQTVYPNYTYPYPYPAYSYPAYPYAVYPWYGYPRPYGYPPFFYPFVGVGFGHPGFGVGVGVGFGFH